MNRLKTVLLIACCSLMMSGCLFEQKRVIDPAAPVAPGEAQSGSANQFSDSLGTESVGSKSSPVQETELLRRPLQPARQPDVVVPELERFMPSVEYVTNRISEYNKKMDRWKMRDSQIAVLQIPAEESGKMVACFQDLQKVLSGYNRLHDTLMQRTSMSTGGPISAKEIYELQQSDIAFLDGFCGQLVAADEPKDTGWMKSEDSATLGPVEALIAQHAANGKFEELVQVWKQMPVEMSARMQLNTKILYGSALMSQQQEDGAAQVFRQIVDQMTIPGGQSSSLLALRKTLADLYVASGKYKEAEVQYLEISKEYKDMATIEEWAILQRSILERSEQGGSELKEYSDILRNYLGFNPARDGYTVVWQADKFLQTYPYSPVASNVDLIRTAAREQADKWSKKVLTDADDLAGQKRYQDALGKLEAVPNTIVSPETQRQITQKTGDLTLAEKLESETIKLATIQELDRQWNEGMRLMEGSQYDKAIEIFTSMLETEYSEKADKKIAEASLLAAEAERRDAADIFIRFTKASDVESKKKLLIESRRRLQDILVKYPEVEIADKVVGNIKRVEKEMDAIDPDLVRQSGRGAGEDQKAVGGVPPAAAASEAGVTGGSFPARATGPAGK
jgi:tetratricopeptide (TPR) repeat protein